MQWVVWLVGQPLDRALILHPAEHNQHCGPGGTHGIPPASACRDLIVDTVAIAAIAPAVRPPWCPGCFGPRFGCRDRRVGLIWT